VIYSSPPSVWPEAFSIKRRTLSLFSSTDTFLSPFLTRFSWRAFLYTIKHGDTSRSQVHHPYVLFILANILCL
jgi:hypothetical protein